MNLEKLAFQIDRVPASYCQMFDRQEVDRQRHQKTFEYSNKLKFFQTRRHNELITYIHSFNDKIFDYEVEDIQKLARAKFLELDSSVVNQEVQMMYEAAESDKLVIKERAMIIQSNDIEIRNNRKAKKQDDMFKPKQQKKKDIVAEIKSPRFKGKKMKEDQTIKSNRTLYFEEKVNNFLQNQLDKQAWQHRGPQIIFEDDPEDLINTKKVNYMERFNKNLADADIEGRLSKLLGSHITGADGEPRTQSDMKVLEDMLKELFGQNQAFSAKTIVRSIKIRDDILRRLYDFKGKLKLPLIRKVLDKVRQDKIE